MPQCAAMPEIADQHLNLEILKNEWPSYVDNMSECGVGSLFLMFYALYSTDHGSPIENRI